MAEHEQLDLAYRLLDLDLVDSEGIRCGKVDDLVLTGEPGEPTYVAAIRTGYGALPARFPRRLRSLARRLLGDNATDIPSRAVEDFDARVELNAPMRELGL
jgi:hypothetical protein